MDGEGNLTLLAPGREIAERIYSRHRLRKDFFQTRFEIKLSFSLTIPLDEIGPQGPDKGRIAHVIDQNIGNAGISKEGLVNRKPHEDGIGVKKHGNKEATTVLSYCKDPGYTCRDAKQNNHRQGRKPQGWQHFK